MKLTMLHTTSDWVIITGSLIAMTLGTSGYFLLQAYAHLDYVGIASMIVATGGLITAIAGLVNASLTRIFPFFKIYVQDRKTDSERYNLANKVQEQLIALQDAHEQISKLQKIIENIQSRSIEQGKAIAVGVAADKGQTVKTQDNTDRIQKMEDDNAAAVS